MSSGEGEYKGAWTGYLFLVVAAIFSIYLFRYYMTGIGGPSLLAVTLVPVTFIMFILDSLRKNELYPRLGLAANYIIGALYIGISLFVLIYIRVEFMDIRTVRAGFWSTTDLVVGGIMFGAGSSQSAEY